MIWRILKGLLTLRRFWLYTGLAIMSVAVLEAFGIEMGALRSGIVGFAMHQCALLFDKAYSADVERVFETESEKD